MVMNKEICKYCSGDGCEKCNYYGIILWRNRVEPKQLKYNKPHGSYPKDKRFD